ncbi:type IV secretion system protein TraC (plasmid) [Polymorphobacter sp. PAMC 29334]|uniref:type IV secretion system protein TraC n=1 Tax=Polymorphobacter sp. PAMC 29334 TaxID=2862331 RepID=UPI001C76F1A4|nr:type IV secretion system protein TraC [Polymorphobacter sp. PAMC 29334]QYE33136.1 type IV secretion system protein TraC [Polymorphobacter sp. PAMC 29334]
MSIFSKIAGAAFGDRAEPDAERPVIGLDMLSSFLPYRSYDAKDGIFLNSRSNGFAIEIPPFVGSDERTGEVLAQFFQEAMPQGADVQVLSWSSPRIARNIGAWFFPRYESGAFYRRMARHRAKHFFNGVWTSLSVDAPFHLKNHRVIISVSVDHKSKSSREELVQCRDGLVSVLRSLEANATILDPVALIALVDDLTSPTTASEDEAVDYNELDPIAEQAVRRDIEIHVHEDRLMLRTERFRPTGENDDGVAEIGEVYPDTFDIRHFGVRNFPQRWAPWECARLIGDLFSDKLRLPCPTATVLCLRYPDETKSSGKAGFKVMRTTSLAESRGAKYMPKIREQSAEWKHVQDQLGEGRKIVRLHYGITTYSVADEGDTNERTLKSIYRSAGWDLMDERFLQIQGLLSALPMTLGDGLGDDMERLKRFKTMLTSTAANMAPMQGEYLGGPIAHLLLVGRRGQPFFWSPFENGAGNHNVTIMGKSGSGKSVLLQEVCAALCGAGAKIVVIDDGRSFMNSVKLQGGAFIEFTMSSGFCLNPFSMIDAERIAIDEDYKLDCLAMLKAIVGQMCRFIDKLNDTERGLIDAAVNHVWDTLGNTGSVHDVAQALADAKNRDAKNLSLAMSPFCKGGTYGGFFVGQSTLKLEADFTVFELSDLSTREELRAVVLTTIMFMTTQMMTCTPRSVKKMLLIDEAWQMLKGGSTADFVEAYARTCRKYGGALCTATQSVNDYYKSPGAQAALENSDWMLVLQQKPETIADFKKHDRLEMDAATETMIRSLKRNGSEYSEVFIKGPEMRALGRLVLDPFSATAYSSSPATYARIEALMARGMTVDAAVEAVAFPEQEVRYDIAAE